MNWNRKDNHYRTKFLLESYVLSIPRLCGIYCENLIFSCTVPVSFGWTLFTVIFTNQSLHVTFTFIQFWRNVKSKISKLEPKYQLPNANNVKINFKPYFQSIFMTILTFLEAKREVFMHVFVSQNYLTSLKFYTYLIQAFVCISTLLAVAAAAPQVYHGVRPAGYGYAAGQTSHQSVTKADGEVRSVQVRDFNFRGFFKFSFVDLLSNTDYKDFTHHNKIHVNDFSKKFLHKIMLFKPHIKMSITN